MLFAEEGEVGRTGEFMLLRNFGEGKFCFDDVVEHGFGAACRQPVLCRVVEGVFEAAGEGAEAHVGLLSQFPYIPDVAVVGIDEVLKVGVHI